MPANTALPVLFTLIVALTPLATYCLVLAYINRRPQPLLVRGVWDFVGVLLGLSGILLGAGPAMMRTLYEREIVADPMVAFDAVWFKWTLIWVAYFGCALLGVVFLLWLRRPVTVIYNVQAERLPNVLAHTLERLGLQFTQNALGQFLVASTRQRPPAELATAITPAASPLPRPALEPPAYSAAIEIDAFSSLAHATLHWYEVDRRLRRDIENELKTQLADARALENPSAGWQLGISVLLFGAVFLAVGFYIVAAVMSRRW